jgi:peroxiredoxin
MSSPTSRTLNTGLLTALAIAIAAGGGWYAQKHLASRQTTEITAATSPAPTTTTAPNDTADTLSDAETDAAAKLPATLPQFTLQDRDGKPRTLADWKGHPVVVNYWATWCPPCVREIPLLSQLRKERAAQKLEVIGIAVDFRDDVLKFAAEKHLDYPLLIGEEEGLAAVTAVGMEPAFPFTLFADGKQRIVAMKVGELHRDDADLILDVLMEVDADRLDLPAARTRIDEGLKALAIKRATSDTAPPTPTAG